MKNHQMCYLVASAWLIAGMMTAHTSAKVCSTITGLVIGCVAVWMAKRDL